MVVVLPSTMSDVGGAIITKLFSAVLRVSHFGNLEGFRRRVHDLPSVREMILYGENSHLLSIYRLKVSKFDTFKSKVPNSPENEHLRFQDERYEMGDILSLVTKGLSKMVSLVVAVEFFDWRSEFLGCLQADVQYREMDRARISVSGWGRVGV
jgi:hypothetical protein